MSQYLIMDSYFDLSILPTSRIQLTHLLKKVQQKQQYSVIALDYQFTDTLLKAPSSLEIDIKGNVKKVTRATLAIEQTATLHQLGQPKNDFQILAIKPLNQKIFNVVCTQYDNYDIMTFDFGTKLPFMLKRNPVYQAIRRGKYFQIQYDHMFSEDRRLICMTNIVNLIKATNGKNIIVSSHAESFKNHRSPYDVISLLISLGMNKEQAMQSIRTNPEQVLKSSMHRKYFKGIIKQMEPIVVKKLGKKIAKHKEKISTLAKNLEKL